MIVIDRIERGMVVAQDSGKDGLILRISMDMFVGKKEDIKEGAVLIPYEDDKYAVDKFTTRIMTERRKKELEEARAATEKVRMEKAKAAAYRYLDTIEAIDLTPDRAICKGTKDGMRLTVHITDDGNGKIVG